MNMTHDEMVEVIRAHAAGKRIEIRDSNPGHKRNWVDSMPMFLWDFINWEYRIKPEPPKPREWILELHEERVIGSDGYSTIRHSATQETHRHQGKKFVHVREVLPDEEGKA